MATGASGAPATPNVDARSTLLHTSWTAREGAPTGITGIAQTPDGWIWIGSTSGLYRFDGVRFLRATGAQAPLASGISAIGVLKDGTLWVGYKYGGVSLMRDGRMRHFGLDDPATPGGTIFDAARDAGGRLWLATSRGLYYLDGRWRRPEPAFGAPDGRAYALLLDRRGTLWVRYEDRVFSLPKGASRFVPGLALSAYGVLAEHPDGSVWTVSLEQPGLHLLAGPERGPPLTWNVDAAGSTLVFDHAGTALVDSRKGFMRAEPAVASAVARPARLDERLSGKSANAMFEDRERNIWVGTENGLDRFKPPRLRPLALPDYIGTSARPLAAEPGGGAWIDNAFVPAPDRAARPYTREPAASSMITALYRAPDGVVWAGWNGSQLGTVTAHGLTRIGAPPDLAAPGLVYALAQDRAGALWVSYGRIGLYTWQAGRWLRGGGVPALAAFAASALATDAQGRVWLGSVNDQLLVLEKGQTRAYGRADGLAIGTLMQILPSGDGAWIGGENGLSRFDGRRFVSVAGTHGDTFAGITGIAIGRDGTLWLNGGNGISSIAQAEWQRALREPGYPVRFGRLDYRDGLTGTTSPIIPVPSLARSDDGTLWFSTTGGVYTFNPASLSRNTLVPPVAVIGLKSGAADYPAVDGTRLPAGTDTLEVDFTALSYQEPEKMEFRYRLDGVDRDWRDSDGRRSASYTNLAPGAYVFRVIASNNDGLWNERGATLAFAIAPHASQTLWFRLLCAAAAAGLLASLYFWRTRQLARRYGELLRERLAERERIARTLHDTLLQSMQGLILRFHGVAKRLPKESAAQQGIEAILDQADKVMTEGRNELMNLRTRPEDGDDIAHALAKFGASLQEHFGPQFTLVVDGAMRAVDSAAWDEIYWIGREALFNAYQHAAAGHVEMEVAHGREQFALFVRDDGNGMPGDLQPDGSRAGHWGVAGMRERALALGGTLEIWSRAGMGTELALRLPAQRVYRAPPRTGARHWLQALLGRK